MMQEIIEANVNVDTESEVIKQMAEETFRRNEPFRPQMKLFDNGKLKANIFLRPAEGDSDKRVAFTEACTLFPYLHTDEVIISFDDWVSTKFGVSAGEDPNSMEALVSMVATRKGAMAIISPYLRDEEGNFLKWKDDIKEEDASPTMLDSDMISTLSHFMQYHRHVKYTKVMIKTLEDRGHQIHVEDSRVPPGFEC